ncbi:MAG: T9SS type A sorting domain-containing protein [Bacteroidales bacterium]|nr:T9SS type A sorting domain-containing protein [Bacteroidales bacterium]
MKKLLSIFCYLLIMGQCLSQTFQTREFADGTKTCYLKGSKGIISAVSGKSFNGELKPDIKFLNTSNTTTFQNNYTLNKPESRISHHVTLRFDVMTFSIIMTSKTNSYGDFNWSSGQTVADIEVQEGIYEIMINTYDFINSGDELYVFLHDLNVNADIDTTIILSEAAHHYVYFHGMDENNIPLLPDDTTIIRDFKQINVEFPAPLIFQSSAGGMIGFPKDYVRFSDVNPDYKISFGQSNVKQGKMYVLDLDQLNGISADTILESKPDTYKKMTNVFLESPSAVDDYLNFHTGTISRLRDDPYYWMYSTFDDFSTTYPSKNLDSLSIYLNNIFKNTNIVNCVAAVDFWEGVPAYDNPEKRISGKPFYITEGDTIQYCLFFPPAKADYSVLNNSIVNFGNSAPFINTYSVNDATSIFSYSDVTGQGNDIRKLDSYSSLYYIKQGTDILQSDTLFRFEQPYTIPASGPYSFSVTDSNYYLKGIQGKVQTRNIFNIPGADPNPPVLTSFKILNSNNIICESYAYSAQATLHFSAADFIDNEIQDISAAYLYYKKYDEENWTSLPVEERPGLYDSIFRYGQYFVSDLTPILSSCTDTTFIDLKLTLADASSNYTFEIFHPAFQVIGHGVGIPDNNLKPSDLNLEIFPNPVTAGSCISFNLSEKSNVRVTLFDITGKCVGTVLDKPFGAGVHNFNLNNSDFNLAGIANGIYLLKLETGETNKTVKFIMHWHD